MTRHSSGRPGPPSSAEEQARRATEALLARIAADRRRLRRRSKALSRDRLVDLVVAMATYSGVTVAIVLGAAWSVGAVLAPFLR